MSTNEAQIPNPALRSFADLVGRWITVGIHPQVPDTVFHGESTFDWLEGGAFLMMRSRTEEPEIPSGIAVFGSDDASGEYFMLYFDERGVSRKYDVAMKDRVLSWSRSSPELSQRFTLSVSDDGRTMVGAGEMSRNGGPWERDLQLTYTRSHNLPEK